VRDWVPDKPEQALQTAQSPIYYRLVFIVFRHFTFNLLHFLCQLCIVQASSLAGLGFAMAGATCKCA
jgi:hypothetical protein